MVTVEITYQCDACCKIVKHDPIIKSGYSDIEDLVSDDDRGYMPMNWGVYDNSQLICDECYDSMCIEDENN